MTYLRNFALGRRNLPVHTPDLRSYEARAVAAAALGLAAGAAGAETPLPQAAFVVVLEEYLRQPWPLE